MRVLLCVDRDPVFDDLLAVLRWGVRLGPDDVVWVLHVIPKLTWTRFRSHGDPALAGQLARLGRDARELVGEVVALLSKEGVRAEPLCREGNVVEQILSIAHDVRTDLVILGALGAEDPENFLLGSVSQNVKLHVDRDCLIVRPSGLPARSRFKTIIAVDGSEESLAAVRSFTSTMQIVLADAHLVHVVEGREFEGPISSVLQEASDEALARARGILGDAGVESTSEVLHGRPAVEIVNAAREQQAQLIVMGARGLSAVAGLLMGSVTQRVIRHAPCTVFCARKPPS